MFTTVAFSEICEGTSEELCAAVPDSTHYTSGDDLMIGKYTKLIAMYASGHALGDCRIVSPSLRTKADLYVSPFVNDLGGYAPYFPRRIDYRGDCPLTLVTNEMLNVYTTSSEVSATQNRVICIWLGEDTVRPVKGEIWTTSAYATGKTIAEKVWTAFELTWAQDLPVGRYQIVGVRCYMVNGGLFRFVPRDTANRPGGVCVHEKALVSDPIQRYGNLGVWLEFDSTLPPQLEALPNAVAGETEVYLRIDLIRVR